jgi:hypothetical protein
MQTCQFDEKGSVCVRKYIMKLKTLIAVASVAAVFGVVPVTQAAFTDDPSFGGYTGTMRFSGTVVDQTPKWMWEVPQSGTAYTAGFEMDNNDGTASNGKLVFSYTAAPNITLLNGYLKAVSPNGGVGLQPLVTLGLAGQNFTLVTGTVSSDSLTATVKATGVPVGGGTPVQGLVQFDLAQAGVIAGTTGATAKLQPGAFLSAVSGGASANGPAVANSSNARYNAALDAATALLANATDWATSPYRTMSLNKAAVWPAATMQDFNTKQLYGAYSSVISNVKSIWTDGAVPETWSAEIGVTVTHQ